MYIEETISGKSIAGGIEIMILNAI